MVVFNLVGHQVRVRIIGPGVQKQDLHAFAGEISGGHPAGGATTYDDDIVVVFNGHYWCFSCVQPGNCAR